MTVPYQSSEVTALDVATEIGNVVAVIDGAVHAAGVNAGPMLSDATREPGQTLLVMKTRLALALEGWLGSAVEDLLVRIQQVES